MVSARACVCAFTAPRDNGAHRMRSGMRSGEWQMAAAARGARCLRSILQGLMWALALRRRGRREQVRWVGAYPKPCPRPVAGWTRLAGLARKCHPLPQASMCAS